MALQETVVGDGTETSRWVPAQEQGEKLREGKSLSIHLSHHLCHCQRKEPPDSPMTERGAEHETLGQ